MQPFDTLESDVRSYCRSFPAIFHSAKGVKITDKDGRTWLDFFAGAGALNYGHAHPHMKDALVEYLTSDRIVHSLDFHTTARATFLERFHEVILQPRGLGHMKVAFPGPTGTNAVELALKFARKATGRESVISFTNGFHGMTLGSLSITGNQMKREGAGVPLDHVQVLPFDGYLGDGVDTVDVMRKMLHDHSSGVEAPAAFVLETVQAEGGVRVASAAWLKKLRALADEVGALLILDDIQVGCGRTGKFFSFEELDVKPDIVTLSKSLSAYGLPFAVVLVDGEHDALAPGEHNGTFRGFNPALVTATAALDLWEDDELSQHVTKMGTLARERFDDLADTYGAEVRGRGLIQGIAFDNPKAAGLISHEAFHKGVLIETAGAEGEVLKLLPPLVVTESELMQGLDILADVTADVMARPRKVSSTDSEVRA